MATVKHVVLDSGAFIRNAPVQNIGESLYSINDVVSEIRDKATRQRLQVLPYDLTFREPSAEAVRTVSEFAKKTGDYRSLSAVDIRIMALTYQLEKEFVGTDHIKTVPDKKIEWQATPRPIEMATEIAGFYIKSKTPASSKVTSRTTSECSGIPDQIELRSDETNEVTEEDIPEDNNEQHTSQSTIDNSLGTPVQDINTPHKNDINISIEAQSNNEVEAQSNNEIEAQSNNEVETQSNKAETQSTIENEVKVVEDQSAGKTNQSDLTEGEILPADCLEEDDETDESDSDDDDDDEGWITPGNIKSVKEKMGEINMEKAEVQVGCLTTDFAMQNVLIQMGLNVVSVDGMLIKRVKSFVLRCFACMKVTTNVQKTFCPQCGNKTLTKVSMTVNDDGSIRYFLSRRRPINKRGTKFSLPMPKGGKHSVNPTLSEDQPSAHNRLGRKGRSKMYAFDPDYMPTVGHSPFNITDVTSKAAMLGIRNQEVTHYWDRKNPNERKQNTGNRKKRK